MTDIATLDDLLNSHAGALKDQVPASIEIGAAGLELNRLRTHPLSPLPMLKL